MKRTVSLLLTLVLLLTLCGCGQKGSAPSWQEQYDLGVRYLSDGNYEEAIIAFTAAIKIDTKNALAYIGRGDAYLGQGAADEYLSAAFTDFETALSLDDTNADAYLGMAEVYIARKQFDAAMEILRQGVEKTGDQRLTDRLAELEDGNISDYWGRTLKEIWYDENGGVTCWFEYDYNDLGQCTDITSYGPSGSQIQHMEQCYDEQGLMIYGCYSWSGVGTMGGATYTYNNVGKCETIVLDSGNSQAFTYDSDGRQIRIDYYDENENLTGYCIYEYGDNYRRESGYSADGTLRHYSTIEYDADGKRIADKSYDGDGNLTSSRTYN
jgi:YD repeat-containing protein